MMSSRSGFPSHGTAAFRGAAVPSSFTQPRLADSGGQVHPPLAGRAPDLDLGGAAPRGEPLELAPDRLRQPRAGAEPGLRVDGEHLQPRGLAVDREVAAGGEPLAVEHGQHEVAPLALGGRRVDLQPVAEPEQRLRAVAVAEQVVEGRQERRPAAEIGVKQRLHVLGQHPPVVAEPLHADPLGDLRQLVLEPRVAPAREVLADVRRPCRAERADREPGRAARDLGVGELLARRVGRQAALHQVPHALGAVAARDPDLPAHPHDVQQPRGVAAVRPAAGALPRLRREILDVARPQRAVVAQALEDVRAEVRLLLVPRGQLARPGADSRPRERAHLVAVDRQVVAEHVGGLVRPVLEQRALLVGELGEARLVERAVAGEEHEQVRAGDHGGRVQLQATQRPRGLQQRLRIGALARERALQPLVANRQAAHGGGRDAEHRGKIGDVAAKTPLRDDGAEPDPRFTFANERTYLAWNRTGLALVGGGLAAGQLLDFDSRVVRLLASLPAVLLGAAIIALSYRRWEANERAMRRGEPLPRYGPPREFAIAATLLAFVIAVLVVVEAF